MWQILWIHICHDPDRKYVSRLFSSLELSYSGRRETNHALAYFGEAFINGPELVQLALEILNFDFEAEEKQVVTRIKKLLEKYDNLDLAIDKEVFVSMLKEYQAKVDKKYLPAMYEKIDTLYNLLCSLGSSSSIVFCNHRDAVDRVHKLLEDKKLLAERFHGGMEQPDRERALYKFRNGSCHVLISTDLAARGLDIPEIEHIIHYHLPVNEEAFTHRNGRTARWDATGTSYLILHTEEKLPEYIPEDIETMELPENPSRPPKSVWTTIYIGKGKKEKLSRMDIAGFLYKKGNLTREDVGAIDVKEHYAFVAVRRAKVKQLLNLIQGEKIKGMKTIIEEAK